MNDLRKAQTAIEAVARRFSATWKNSGDSRHAYITVGGKRVALEIRTLKPGGADRGNAAKPGLRFDKVVTRVTRHLEAALGKAVPEGMTVLVTITAPIRLPGKTATALQEKIHISLECAAPGRDEKTTIYRNHIRIRLLQHECRQAPKMIGFVHNPGTDPLALFGMTGELLELFGAEADKKHTRLAGDRWLVAVSPRAVSCVDAYRYICSQLRVVTGFKKILMLFSDGRVEVLEER
jgi:hypothetical protein